MPHFEAIFISLLSAISMSAFLIEFVIIIANIILAYHGSEQSIQKTLEKIITLIARYPTKTCINQKDEIAEIESSNSKPRL